MTDAAVEATLAYVEAQYVRTLNAILASPGGDGDAQRWQGNAQAYRNVAQTLRRSACLPAVDYRDPRWREAHGVYPATVVAGLRRG